MTRARRPGLALPSILLLLGILVTAAVVQRGRVPGQARDLLDLIERRRAATRELSVEVSELADRLASAQAERAEGSTELADVLDRVDRLRSSAGLGPMEGPGLVVELRDSEDAPRTRGEALDLRIQDVDLQLVVNALWAGGGRAVSVNGRRVASTTAIREAGGQIQVNFGPLSSPYRITALGDPDELRRGLESSPIAGQLEVWTELYGLGFSVRAEDVLRVPGLDAPTGLSWARPADEAAA